MTHPKVLAMARELAANERGVEAMRKAYLDGTRDDQCEVRVAIAAIECTTELAEDWLRHDLDEWPDYVAPADLADAIADFPHLFEPSNDEGGV